MNVICNVSDVINGVLFGDTSLTDNDLCNLNTKLNQELRNIFRSVTANKWAVKINKTNFILFERRFVVSNFKLFYGGCHLISVSSTKFLGVITDENLNWKKVEYDQCVQSYQNNNKS